MKPIRTALTGILGLTLIAGVVPSSPSAHAAPPAAAQRVIVVGAPGRLHDAEQALESLGGTVSRDLPIINGFAASLPADRVAILATSGAVAAVTNDAEVSPMSVDPTLGYDPASTDSLSAISQITGAQAMWNAGYVGKGIDVALIDTGVSRVPGLNGTGKVVDGPDLSFDSIEPTLIRRDAFGHGTHMAGIIAGTDVAPGTSTKGCKTCLGKSAYTNTAKFVGIAPEARIINVKVGAYDGAADISQVIAGIDWVVQHSHDPGFNIRVLNLSFGTDSALGASLDPLVHAADVAWASGIVVVAAAGNEGMLTSSLASPALSPSIIAVGASDPVDTIDTADDKVARFAQHGNATRSVDFIAPGVSVLSLRVPGAFVDQNIATGKVGSRFQQASGTSQSTAVVSGLVAVLLSKYPTATPDMIKAYLKGSAKPVVLTEGTGKLALLLNTWYSGSGSAYIGSATSVSSLPKVDSVVSTATGLGTLEGSRGSYHVSTGTSTLSGEQDIFGRPWDATVMASLTSTQATWNGGKWNGSQWTGNGWDGARWTSSTWTSSDWSGARWTGARWTDMEWDGARWTGARWTGARWTAGTWDGARWTGARWSDDGWG